MKEDKIVSMVVGFGMAVMWYHGWEVIVIGLLGTYVYYLAITS